MTLGKLTLVVWLWFGLMSAGFLPLCLLASQVPGPNALHIALYVLIVGVLWWGSFGYGMYLGQAMQNGDKRVFQRGIRGTGTVLETKGTHTYIGGNDMGYGGSRLYRIRMRVELPGREPYETRVSMTSHGLREGDRVEVGVAKHNRRRVAVDLSPGALQRQAAQRAAAARAASAPSQRKHPAGDSEIRLDRLARQQKAKRPHAPEDAVPPGYAAAHADGQGGVQPHGGERGGDHRGSQEAERIRQLSELGRLHKEGVLSDEEFAAEKARILGFSS
ncbi:SHOCT domain-containing protein [Streptacidiphilus jiangxiensis]|uniref:Short C-terminal domain-containing protein n=1 Tax=Streptacidiphilus jiangxiensis TaxID=235985 RepID=A0A1H7VUQ3_STRJI|nr:SHOCT domain-containing protein [Streptacidiphilus jiangxiensis]SEM12900.1 Short C-terminal domain-containing protein [Streptacidiphilus jiangxiensis]